MKNVSGGDPSSWIQKTEGKKTQVVHEEKPKIEIDLSEEINVLKKFLSNLREKYDNTSDKHMYDAIVEIDGAIRSLEKV